jgi:quinol monooxygenase YgiN
MPGRPARPFGRPATRLGKNRLPPPAKGRSFVALRGVVPSYFLKTLNTYSDENLLFLLAFLAATPAGAQDSAVTTPVKTFTYHGVEDFATWKAMYDGAYEMRRQAGELTSTVGVLADRPNTIWVINTWVSTAAATAHLKNKEVAAKMAEGGVTSPPIVYFLDQKDKGILTNGAGVMTLTMHPVTEFGKWKNMFDGAEAIRKTAGELDYETGGVNGDPKQ